MRGLKSIICSGWDNKRSKIRDVKNRISESDDKTLFRSFDVGDYK